MKTQISATVKNAFQAVLNRVMLETKKGTSKEDVKAMVVDHLTKMANKSQNHYDKEHLLDKTLFNHHIESEYINQVIHENMRNFLKDEVVY
ncbi:MAG: hypothetical protein CL760_09565 [Chloroflexi bacterium]|nr:hypothetical protein [Chloroflexota bacterium]|tara:strand:- start:4106 stop:4378 length:273 start_codon:yes stop_codon:yes gene_type:complete